MKSLLLSFTIIFLCFSCSSVKKTDSNTPIQITSQFDNNEVRWFKTKGNGTIKGIAKFKSKKGEIRFGKTFRIELMPSCSYTKERLQHIYNSKKSGYVYVEDGIPKFIPDPDGYHDTIKTMCNDKGEFEFNNLPSGNYYIIAFMLWDSTGGGIMQHVSLSKGELKSVEMLNFK